ncbi:alpha/beta hydrolase [Acrocarpospora macrocephala]|nr:alpha/beta fold hydrolase [Acrocarpospora macrocephala]
MTTQVVTFNSHGDTVHGDLYLPEGPGPHPAVVLAGGWCYVKELRQPQYAEAFAAKGVAALVIDYRRLGASEGTPRQHIDPWDQIEDYRNAITYLEGRDEVDSDRIGAWGISYSGGHVLILGAVDPRVKAVVSNVPVVQGYETMVRAHGSERYRALESMLLEDRRKRFQTGEYGYLPMSQDPSRGLSTWPFDEIRVVFEDLKKEQAPRHEHRSTIASTEMLLEYDVFPFLPRLVATPTMMIIAEGDDITMWDLETEAFNRIPTRDKELVVLPKTSHMTLYSNLTALDLAATAAATWFADHLLDPPSIDKAMRRYQK